ncbi:MAG: hypothetical protein BAJATHORv1_60082 [Candidatus Thorarchaeota archaeon]|nr:MAG: hypothetical protein BAJATHORv1_60082 [Candidatus Thorarchaeota archaeon]
MYRRVPALISIIMIVGLIPLHNSLLVGMPSNYFGYEYRSINLGWFLEGEVQGLATDGRYLYMTSSTTIQGTGEACLYKMNFDGTLISSVRIGQDALCHGGGITIYDNFVWIPLAEFSFTPSNSSQIMRYSLDLDYVDSFCNSTITGIDHWGSVFVDEVNQRVFVSNWNTLQIHEFDMDGNLIQSIIPLNPDAIQDWVVIDNHAFGSCSREGITGLVIFDLDGSFSEIRVIGDLRVPKTSSGIAYHDGVLYSCSGVNKAVLSTIEINLHQYLP